MEDEIRRYLIEQQENIKKKAEERSIPLEERIAIQRNNDAKKLLSEIPNNTKELTTNITRKLIEKYIVYKDNELYKEPIKGDNSTRYYGIYSVKDATSDVLDYDPEVIKAAYDLYSESGKGELYYGDTIGLTTINEDFFSKYGVSIKHGSELEKSDRDALYISYTKKSLTEFVNDILNGNYKNTYLRRCDIERKKKQLVLLDSYRNLIDCFLERTKESISIVTLDICKRIAMEYSKLAFDDGSETLTLSLNVRNIGKQEEVLEPLRKYGYLDNALLYKTLSNSEKIIKLPDLRESLKELGVTDVTKPDYGKINVIVNINDFVDVVLNLGKEEKTK